MKFNAFSDTHYVNLFDPQDEDLQMLHKLADEFYTVHCPKLTYVEISREKSMVNEDLDKLWGEQVGGLKISRKIDFQCFPKYTAEPTQRHKKYATEIEHDVRIVTGLLELKRKDLYPEMGDHVLYKGFEYELMRVFVDTEHLYMQTELPIHVTMLGVIYRPGDVKHTQGSDKI